MMDWSYFMFLAVGGAIGGLIGFVIKKMRKPRPMEDY